MISDYNIKMWVIFKQRDKLIPDKFGTQRVREGNKEFVRKFTGTYQELNSIIRELNKSQHTAYSINNGIKSYTSYGAMYAESWDKNYGKISA